MVGATGRTGLEANAPEAGPPAKVLPWLGQRATNYGPVFSRVFKSLPPRLSRIFAEQRQAGLLCHELLGAETRERRQVLVRNTRRYHHLSVCDQLLDRSVRLVLDEPQTALELAELSLQLANEIDGGDCSHGLLGDARARAWAALGNAHRALGFLAASALAFRRAHAHLERGTGNPLEEAAILELEALLLGRLGEVLRADAAVERQARLCEQFDEPHHSRRARLHRASLRARRGDHAGAARLCQRWLELPDAAPDPTLAKVARGSWIAFLDLAGLLLEAHRLPGALDRAEGGPADGWAIPLAKWLDGKARAATGEFGQASCAFASALAGFSRRGDWFEATRAALDLLALAADQRDEPSACEARRQLSGMLASSEVEGSLRAIIAGLVRGGAEFSRDHLEVVRRELALAQSDPEIFVIRSL